MLRRVERGAFVGKQRAVGKHAKAVRTARRNVELAVVFFRERHRFPLPVSRRAAPHIDGNVKHLAGEHLHQFSLPLRMLQMQPAQHAAHRTRHVILHKLRLDTRLAVAAGVPAFHEKTARIAKHARLDNQGTVQTGRENSHDAKGKRKAQL